MRPSCAASKAIQIDIIPTIQTKKFPRKLARFCSAVKRSVGSFVLRGWPLVIGCLGLSWGLFALPQSELADDFRDIEDRLLHFETFRPATLARTIENQRSQELSACDTHSQRAMLLMEMSLADSALRSG